MSQSQSPNLSGDDQQIILRRINQIRREVKRVELITTLVVLLTCLLGFFMVSMILDHWIFRSGTPIGYRVVLISGFLLGGVTYFILRLLPLLRFSVNPAYAAKILENSHPEMKNRLLNWVFLKQEKRSSLPNLLERHILDGIDREAAVNLTRIPPELIVDHRQAVRWGIGFTVLLAFFFLYTVFSPKSPMDSIVRTVNPFTSVAAPQSIVIKEVSPGDITVFQGESTQITARLDRATKFPVHVVYSTNDGRFVEQRLPMTAKEDSYHFETRFPPGKKGFEESLVYWIEAGNSRSKSWNVTVRPAVYLETKAVEYRFPEYTGLTLQRVENTGDIQALEGTEVTLYAESNVPLGQAEILFDGKPDKTASMTISPEHPMQATFTFTLQCDPANPEKPLFSTYTLRCRDKEKNANPQPVYYTVNMIRDLPPGIRWIDEEKLPKDVPLNSLLSFQAEAEDPDFGLRNVRLRASKIEQGDNPADILNQPFPSVELLTEPHAEKVTLEGNISPQKLGLKPGDRVDYFVEAADTKLPEANITGSSLKSFFVTDPVDNPNPQKDAQNQSPNQNPQGKEDDSQNQSDRQNNGGDQGNSGGEKSQGEKEEQDKGGEKENSGQQNGNPNGSNPPQQGDPNSGGQQENPPQDTQQSNDPAKGGQSGQDSQNSTEDADGGPSQSQQREGNKDGDGECSGNVEEKTANGENNNETGDTAEPQKREKPIDGESNPGDVFREAVKRMKEKGEYPDDPIAQKPSSSDDRTEKEQPSEKQDDLPQSPTPQGEKTSKEGTQDVHDNGPSLDDRKTEEGTPPQERPKQQGEDSHDRSPADAYNAKQGDNSGTKPLDPSEKDKPIYTDPNDAGKKNPNQGNQPSDGEGQNPDEWNMENPPKGGTPKEPQSGEQKSDLPENPPSQKPKEKPENGSQPTAGDPSKSASDPQSSPEENALTPQNPQNNNKHRGSGAPPDGNGQEDAAVQNAKDPNLEYTEKATSLVIDYLDKELGKQQPDQKLLDKLGWSKEDLNRFVSRWKEMQSQASQAPKNSKESKEWLDTLRNIGRLAPKTTEQIRDVQRKTSTAAESQRYVPPAKWRDRAEAYSQGLSGGTSSHGNSSSTGAKTPP
ncbi:MAG: hypothetical protein LBQ54_06050 [Planctomycetaceae bacterium]|jgi:hypothetical protein|nr:hypothetical protein [Planctomycetaceae bacterium]